MEVYRLSQVREEVRTGGVEGPSPLGVYCSVALCGMEVGLYGNVVVVRTCHTQHHPRLNRPRVVLSQICLLS